MRTLQVVTSAIALAAVTLLAAGCASSPASPASASTGSAPTSTGSDSTPPADQPGPMPDDVEAAWLDGGRAFAIVTWGSSSTDCQPATAVASADGQRVSVTLTGPELEGDAACNSDLGPHAILVEVPAGVDITKDVEIDVAFGDLRDDTDLDGLPGPVPIDTDYQPSAGWFDDTGIVLLTWGSSTCRPVVEDVTATDAGATVTFVDGDPNQPCTEDLVPRLTVLSLQDEPDDDAPFALTLTGGGLDGTVPVRS